MNYDQIPDELHMIPQWLNWQYEMRPGKPTKVPYSPRAPHTRASSTAADTWGTYDEALMALQRRDVNGLGFVFTADDDYTGIDLDKCVDSAGVLEPWAQSIVDAMDSYTELSPSGRGLHIIIRGKLPPGRRRRGRIEVYDQGRYFTMTGNSLGPPKPIVLRDIELEAFIESYLADARPTRPASPPLAPAPSGNPMPDRDVQLRMLSCAAGPRIRRLWRGDTTGYGSASEADLALVSRLLWWCKGDRDQVDRLFRMSGLYREKWDRTDYRERTLNVAMEG